MLREYFSEEKYDELKNSDNLIYKAVEITTELFKDDLDKGGYPYLMHLFYTYNKAVSTDEKVVALLHDILEKKEVSEEDLKDVGFSKKIIDDIKVLTRVKPIEYKDYIDNLVKNGSKEALNVKLSALMHSMDMKRIKNPTVKDYERVEKRYTPAYNKILNRLGELE